MMLPSSGDEAALSLARQMGINNAITKAAPDLSGLNAPYDFDALETVVGRFRKFGIKVYGLEGDQFDMSPIKLGLPNRDEHIEKYRQMLRNMGRLGINLLCLNWMASIGWFRSRVDEPERGGALTTSFDFADLKDKLVDEPLRIDEAKLRENLFYFLDAVLPVAEESGVKMGLHPDDPPISPLCGVARILSSPEDYEKIFAKFDSPNLGATFCQANFKLMGCDVKKVSADWIARNKVFFVHIRDVSGDKYKFTETFIDSQEGYVADMLAHYARCGFDGVLRSDHAPAMYGETQKKFGGGTTVGYQMLGHLFSNGYIKGCCHALKIPLE